MNEGLWLTIAAKRQGVDVRTRNAVDDLKRERFFIRRHSEEQRSILAFAKFQHLLLFSGTIRRPYIDVPRPIDTPCEIDLSAVRRPRRRASVAIAEWHQCPGPPRIQNSDLALFHASRIRDNLRPISRNGYVLVMVTLTQCSQYFAVPVVPD